MEGNFKEFLQHNLSWYDYEHLNEHLGLKAKGVFVIIKDPWKGNKLQLEKIISLLHKWNKGWTANIIVKKYSFGVKEAKKKG